MSDTNRSSLEEFFHIAKPESNDKGNDPLSWESLTEGTADNIDRFKGGAELAFASGSRAVEGFREGSTAQLGMAQCQSAFDCGSGFVCAGGMCVPAQGGLTLRSSTNAVGSTAQSTDGTNCGTGINPGGTGGGGGGYSCSDDGCSSGATCGQGSGFSGCCGGTTYRCSGGPPQCTPCAPPPDKECTDYCDSAEKSSGSQGLGCNDQHCGECASCSSGTCSGSNSSAPCSCAGDNNGCGKCETCDNQTGECVEKAGVCSDCCNCTVTCPCGKRLKGSRCQEHYGSGLVCASACRAELYKQCESSCPPPRDTCKADPSNPCEANCRCVFRCTPGCPSGKRCKQKGEVEYNGKTCYWVKECDEPPSDCGECDCHCENDCPDCYNCSSEGTCVPDPSCGEDPDNPDVCDGIPCDGDCCPEGYACVTAKLYTWKDNCHGYSGGVYTPFSAGLEHYSNIEAKYSACSRAHSHCAVVVNGPCGKAYVGYHLDCGSGLRQGRGNTKRVCVNLNCGNGGGGGDPGDPGGDDP